MYHKVHSPNVGELASFDVCFGGGFVREQL